MGCNLEIGGVTLELELEGPPGLWKDVTDEDLLDAIYDGLGWPFGALVTGRIVRREERSLSGPAASERPAS